MKTDAIITVNGLGHERRQGSALAIVVDDTFLYIGMLFLEFLEDFSLRGLRIEGQQLVYECFYPVKALFGGSKVEQFFYGKDPGTMNDGLVGMVYQHIAIGLVFLAEETTSTPKFFFISFCSSSLLAHTSRYFFR